MPRENRKDIIDVKAKDIQEYINYKLKNGRRDNKQGGLSPASMKKQKSILTQMFNDIMYEDIIKNNPVYVCKIKRTMTLSRNAKFLTIVQAKEVISIFKNDILYIPVKLAIYYGMRRSEILGLQWENINLEEETITIKNTLVKINTVIYKESLKTEYSEGTYKLHHDLVSDLKQMKIKKTGFVFQYNGKPIRPDYLTKHFQKVLKQNNYPKMRFHDLRHTTASILFELGMNPKDIQLYMRHSDIETTLDIYSHVTEDMQRSAAMKIDRAVTHTEPLVGLETDGQANAKHTQEKPKFEPYKGKKRKPGTGYVKQLSPNCWQGRYTPTVNGKRVSHNIYAPTEEKCERKLAELIAEIKEQLKRAKHPA